MKRKQSSAGSAVGVASTRPLPVQRDEIAGRCGEIRKAQGTLVSLYVGPNKIVKPTAKQEKHIDGVLDIFERALAILNLRLLDLDEETQKVIE